MLYWQCDDSENSRTFIDYAVKTFTLQLIACLMLGGVYLGDNELQKHENNDRVYLFYILFCPMIIILFGIYFLGFELQKAIVSI